MRLSKAAILKTQAPEQFKKKRKYYENENSNCFVFVFEYSKGRVSHLVEANPLSGHPTGTQLFCQKISMIFIIFVNSLQYS